MIAETAAIAMVVAPAGRIDGAGRERFRGTAGDAMIAPWRQAMTEFERFKQSLAAAAPPDGLTRAVEALWWDAKGDWNEAHRCAQAQGDAAGAWVHAYLHRKEGDAANAGYWYRRAGKTPATVTLEEEWAAVAAALLPQTAQ
jgi:hypothetical protein